MNNITIYNERLRKSLLDKLFFLDKIPQHEEGVVIVDIGCGDGSLIKMCNTIFPEYEYIGVDKNRDMLQIARQREAENITFGPKEWYKDVITVLSSVFKPRLKVLVLSSVIHEVQDKEKFFKWLNLDTYDYVVIRDMYYLHDYKVNPHELQFKDTSLLDPRIISYYENNFNSETKILQAIMKNHYLENLDTELKENYFSFNLHKLIDSNYASKKFNIVYKEFYTLPYWRERFLEYGIDLKKGITTHIKLILKMV